MDNIKIKVRACGKDIEVELTNKGIAQLEKDYPLECGYVLVECWEDGDFVPESDFFELPASIWEKIHKACREECELKRLSKEKMAA